MADLLVTHRGNGSVLRTLGWGAFLGASWTWCIGMFLPVLLVRDYGLWAFAVFAIPNVVGAAAMGWVLRDAEASARTLTNHQPAVVAFSMVTMAFHVFFLLAIVAPLVRSWFVLPVTVIAMLVVLLIAHNVRGGWLVAAAVTLAASVVLWVMLASRGALAMPAQQGQWSSTALLHLLPVTIFGFALCPYLDITFHRARQATSPADGRLAFGVGFGGFFLAMIVMTLLYAPLLITRRAGGSGSFNQPALPPASIAVWLVALHMAVQSAFTLVAHGRYAGRRVPSLGAERTTVLASVTIALLIGAIIASGRIAEYHGLSGTELAYRFFLAFYGLVFPAYVWICMVPTRAGELAPGRALATFVVATVLAAPMFWLGFMERRTVWLLPGVAIVLLAQVVVRLIGPRLHQEKLVTLPSGPPDTTPPPPPSDPDDETKNFLTAAK